MNPLLFLGRDSIAALSNPTIPAEEREAYSSLFSAYSLTEEGKQLPNQLVEAFNALDADELPSLAPEVMLWYLDWVEGQGTEILCRVQPRLLSLVWFMFSDAAVRARVTEALVANETGNEIHPSESQIKDILRHLSPEYVGDDQSLCTGLEEILGIIDILLICRNKYATRVLAEFLGRLSGPSRERCSEHVRQRVKDLGQEEAEALMHILFPPRRG